MTSVWEDRWKAGRTGWDKGKPAPALVQLLTSSSSSSSSFINIPSNGKFLVPGCGGGWDCFVIAETGPNRQVIGFDLSETAVETAKKNLLKIKNSTTVSFLQGDFFSSTLLEPAGSFDFIYDYTFFCAIPPTMRKSWGERMAELIVPGSGLLVALMFPIDKYDDCEGPPFALQPEDYHAVLGDYFELVDSFVPNESHNGREGREKLSVWRRRKVD